MIFEILETLNYEMCITMRGNQGAVTAFFLGAAELGLGVLGALAFKVGVGQIVQDDAPAQIE